MRIVTVGTAEVARVATRFIAPVRSLEPERVEDLARPDGAVLQPRCQSPHEFVDDATGRALRRGALAGGHVSTARIFGEHVAAHGKKTVEERLDRRFRFQLTATAAKLSDRDGHDGFGPRHLERPLL